MIFSFMYSGFLYNNNDLLQQSVGLPILIHNQSPMVSGHTYLIKRQTYFDGEAKPATAVPV